nr:hypothetical protein [Tanacetum cinerariifolium]
MSTQQDIYDAGSKNRPSMLNKDKYVPWSSRIIRYVRSRQNGKMIVDSIENGTYVRRMIATPGKPDLPVLMNQEEVNELRAERLVKSHDPLALMAHSQNSFNFPITHKDQSSSSTHHNNHFQSTTRNGGNQFGQYVGQVAQNQQGFNAWQNGRIQGAQNAGGQTGGNQNGLVVVQGIANQSGTGNVVANRAKGTRIRNQARCYNCRGLGHIARNCTARPRRRDAAYLQTQLLISQKEEAVIQLQTEEYDFMADTGDLDKIKEVNANCILMANLLQASTSGTQHDMAPVYDIDGSAEVHLNDNYYDNEIFNMFTQEEQYTDLLELIPEPQLVPQNDNHVTFVAPSMVHSGGTVETSSAPNEEIPYNDMQQKVERLQAQLRDLKGKHSNTPSALNTLDPLHQKLESKIVELEFQVVNYEREISHLKTTYKNLFDSIKSNRAHAKLHDLIYKNAQLRARGFENTFESVKNTSGTSVTPHVDKPKLSVVPPLSKKLHVSMPDIC